MKKVVAYFKLIRTHNFPTFIQFLLGFLVAGGKLNQQSLINLIKAFILLGPLLYGAIYIFNNIVDYPLDRKSHLKKDRPLVKGEIKLKMAWRIFFLHLILSALGFILFRSSLLFAFGLFFLINNIAYTLYLKRIPYLEVVVCSLGHPSRTALGIFLARNDLRKFILLLIINLNTVVILNILKRLKAKDFDNAESRPVLKHYRRKHLIQLIIILTTINFALLLLLPTLTQLVLGLGFSLFAAIPVTAYTSSDQQTKIKLLKLWR